ncbi:hypothetical protein CANCADRAFT_26456 [Tortispora caseinolytica NRRL Y-17796]|uniref:Ubiquinone biosynthesis protein n=1 Tax=Tortispora caseinolytica NRRL Y-17796 TaxID=767744 RepID=A0A1E4THE7_9ASCO|nr:hypothetical protein CANCADRAFT_26456 [Tortispora caseinolytica NRRL Y-17796]
MTLKAKILAEALKFVPEQGFTEAALASACRELGYTDTALSIFSDGALDLLLKHLDFSRASLAEYTLETSSSNWVDNLSELGVYRLRQNLPVRNHLGQGLALGLNPTNIPLFISQLALLADELAYKAGYSTSDVDWYTTRAAIGALYGASEVYMCKDHSNQCKDTISLFMAGVHQLKNANHNISKTTEWGSFTLRSTYNLLASLLAKG